MQPIIEIKNISKQYQINHRKGGYIALRDVLSTVAKSPFNFIKTKIKQATGLEKKEEFWALKDVNFEIQAGEVVGIIGSNGAGKSTLLKILSQITPPTEGEVIIRGRIASLLEVGTGFHPELTGRENIFLNGAILGMSREEIVRKFDDIVAFSEVERFLDTPVKYYSSGMYVRLAFSIAVHMEPDILIIDEVLAVGDSQFQKKCLDKMDEITKTQGRTILFVSHNLITVQKLCTKAILLERGKIKKIGKTDEVIDVYMNGTSEIKPELQSTPQLRERKNIGEAHFTEIKMSNTEGSGAIKSTDSLRFTLAYSSDFSKTLEDVRMVITVVNEQSGNTVLRLDSDVTAKTFGEKIKASGEIICETDKIHLISGKYFANVDLLIQGTSCDYVKKAIEFEVSTDLSSYGYKINPDASVCDTVLEYSFKQ